MAQCMAMGQAAGTAAGMARTSAGAVREIPIVDLRRRLVADGAILDPLEARAA
jgi:uncharacterized protein YceK